MTAPDPLHQHSYHPLDVLAFMQEDRLPRCRDCGAVAANPDPLYVPGVADYLDREGKRLLHEYEEQRRRRPVLGWLFAVLLVLLALLAAALLWWGFQR